jgi:hypothetical protein
MDAIKLIGTSHNGQLIVDVPEELNDKELEIMVISSKEKQDMNELTEKKRNIEELLSIIGAAKYPDFPITKYDVYDQ